MDTPEPPRVILATEAVRTCIEVLRAIEADRSTLTHLPQQQRRELLTLAGLIAKPERHDLVKMAKAFRRADRAAARERDRQLIQQTGLRVQLRATRYTPLWLPEPQLAESPAPPPTLGRALNCYVCKQPFTVTHRYYDSLCRECGDFNYVKRGQSADLAGHYALITGARVKIGFQAALKLLRAGAHVIVTTRFPVDAAERYAQEADYPQFKDRLQIHGLDLRHSPSVEIFTRFLLESLPRLDYLLNNACQTVRRPAAFFAHLLEKESVPSASLPETLRGPLAAQGLSQRSEALFPLEPVLLDPDDGPGIISVCLQGRDVLRRWPSGHHVFLERAADGLDVAHHRLRHAWLRAVAGAQHEAALVSSGELDPDTERADGCGSGAAVACGEGGEYLVPHGHGASGDRHEAADLGDDVREVGALAQGGSQARDPTGRGPVRVLARKNSRTFRLPSFRYVIQ